MGTQPEEIERSLKGKRTLPRPGDQPNELGGEGEGKPVKKTGPQGGEATDEDYGKGIEGKEGQLFTKDEEQRFQARGGRFNAATKEGKDRV